MRIFKKQYYLLSYNRDRLQAGIKDPEKIFLAPQKTNYQKDYFNCKNNKHDCSSVTFPGVVNVQESDIRTPMGLTECKQNITHVFSIFWMIL